MLVVLPRLSYFNLLTNSQHQHQHHHHQQRDPLIFLMGTFKPPICWERRGARRGVGWIYDLLKYRCVNTNTLTSKNLRVAGKKEISVLLWQTSLVKVLVPRYIHSCLISYSKFACIQNIWYQMHPQSMAKVMELKRGPRFKIASKKITSGDIFASC